MWEPTFTRELEVESDYGQIYVYDPGHPPAVEFDSPDDNPLIRALEDASGSRRFVGYDRGVVDILAPSQYNENAPLRLEIGPEAPPDDSGEWQHVAEVPLPVPSGTIVFEASGGGAQIETTVPPDCYRARVSWRGHREGVGEIEGAEEYLLQLWPAPEAAPTLLKSWPGWDTIYPASPA